jgi:hypothetical protein
MRPATGDADAGEELVGALKHAKKTDIELARCEIEPVGKIVGGQACALSLRVSIRSKSGSLKAA